MKLRIPPFVCWILLIHAGSATHVGAPLSNSKLHVEEVVGAQRPVTTATWIARHAHEHSPSSLRAQVIRPTAFLELHGEPAKHPEPPLGLTKEKDDKKPNTAGAHSLAVGIGALSGWIIGSLSGAIIGYPFDLSRVCGLTAGAVCSVVGAVIGHLFDLHHEMYHPTSDAYRPSGNDTESGDIYTNTTELPEPALEKFHQLALTAVAVSDYEINQAKGRGNWTEIAQERREEEKAGKALADIANRINTTVKEPLGFSEAEVADIQEVIADSSELVTAEAALENNALVTANDVARVSAGQSGSPIRGEDLGAVGDLPSFQGDMIPENQTQLALFQQISASLGLRNIAAGKPWKWSQIKYCFASDVTPRVKHIFLAAVKQYKAAMPCLAFWDVGWAAGSSTSPEYRQKCQQSPAIFVQSDPAQGCYSYVGMVEYRQSQRLQLQDPGCAYLGTALHELGHALGMAHEQSRPDRDNYVRVNWQNVQAGAANQFDIVPSAYTQVAYDLLSIMHYDRFAFAADPKKPSMDYYGYGVTDELGQRAGLSSYDVKQIEKMYQGDNPYCKGNALAGMGCINKPNDLGQDPCNIAKCTSTAAVHCCACGGGVKVQCYKDQPCPQVQKLPGLAPADCIQDATHLFPGGPPCVYTNVCSFDVKFDYWGCTHVARSKSYEAAMCNNQHQTRICKAPWECNVRKA